MDTNNFRTEKNILVVGDWMVDENWIVSEENSETSSHVGDQLYESKITGNNAQLLTLCGAGSIARLLHSLYSKNNKVQIFGLGYWDPDDTYYLAALFRSDCKVYNQTPHSLRGMYQIAPAKAKATVSTNPLCRGTRKDCFDFCQKKDLKCLRLHSLSDKKSGTNHILRIYSQSGLQKSHLLHRYDWNYKKPENKNIKKRIEEALLKINKNIDIVVIVDHNKGGASSDLINCLKNNNLLNTACWYARAKNPNAEWIEKINDKLILLVTGPMLLDNETPTWFLGKHLSFGAIKWLCEKYGTKLDTLKESETNKYILSPNHNKNNNEFTVVAFHNDNNLAALVPQKFCNAKDSKDSEGPIIFLTKKVSPIPSYRIGRTSVLFSSLIASFERIFEKNSKGKEKYKIDHEDFEIALKQAYTWCVKIENHINQEIFTKDSEETDLNFREYYKKALKEYIIEDNIEQERLYGDFEIYNSSLKKEIDSWNKSLNFKTSGIVGMTNSYKFPSEKFQVWRGWSPVKNYITLSRENQKAISGLIIEIKKFKKDQNQGRSLSCLIVGDPGSGKSFLIESLSKQMDIEFLEFNITQLSSIDDLLYCFDTISSIQTNTTKPLLVFWDEIDATIKGIDVYSYFLGPIWNKTYRRGGQTFRLRPCIWIFAGTKDLLNLSKNNPNEEIPKVSDFLSRINGPIIKLHSIFAFEGVLDYQKMENAQKKIKIEKMEQLYMAVSLVTQRFPKVILISKYILEYFKLIEPKYGIRSLEYILSQLKNLSNKLSFNNLPEIDIIAKWINSKETLELYFNDNKKIIEKESDYVRIYTEPPK